MASEPLLFLVIEGKETDPWFYDEIARRSQTVASNGYLIYQVEYATAGAGGSGGGKPLIGLLYQHLREAGELQPRSRTGGKKSVLMLMDADHDVLAADIIRSKHVCYTYFADAEADLYNVVDLSRLISSLCSVPHGVAAAKAASMQHLRSTFARDARDWIELCIAASSAHVPGPRLGANAPLDSATGTVDQTQVTTSRNNTRARAHDQAALTRAFRRARTRANRYYQTSDEYRLVKGKVIAILLQAELDKWSKANGYGHVEKSAAVLAGIRALADMESPMFDYYRNRMENLI